MNSNAADADKNESDEAESSLVGFTIQNPERPLVFRLEKEIFRSYKSAVFEATTGVGDDTSAEKLALKITQTSWTFDPSGFKLPDASITHFNLQEIPLDNVLLDHDARKEVEKSLRKLQTLINLQHPNIVDYKAAGLFMEVRDNMPKILQIVVTQFCQVYDGSLENGNAGSPASTLYDFAFNRKNSGSCLSTLEIGLLAKDILLGLDFLHKEHIAHFDIKPQNVLLYRDNSDNPVRAKVADIDESMLLTGTRTRTGEFQDPWGTLYFSSPEVTEHYNLQTDNSHLGRRADIWSFGATILWCLNPVRITENLTPPLPSEAVFPSPLADLITVSMRKDYRQRPRAKALLQHYFFEMLSTCTERTDLDVPQKGDMLEYYSILDDGVMMHYLASSKKFLTCCEDECIRTYELFRHNSYLYKVQLFSAENYDDQVKTSAEQRARILRELRLRSQQGLHAITTDLAESEPPGSTDFYLKIEDGMLLMSHPYFRMNGRFPWKFIKCLLYSVAKAMKMHASADDPSVLSPSAIIIPHLCRGIAEGVELHLWIGNILRRHNIIHEERIYTCAPRASALSKNLWQFGVLFMHLTAGLEGLDLHNLNTGETFSVGDKPQSTAIEEALHNRFTILSDIPSEAQELLKLCLQETASTATWDFILDHTFFQQSEYFMVNANAHPKFHLQKLMTLPKADGATASVLDDSSIVIKVNFTEKSSVLINTFDGIWNKGVDTPLRLEITCATSDAWQQFLRCKNMFQLSDLIIGLSITTKDQLNTETVLDHLPFPNLLYIDIIGCNEVLVGPDSFKSFPRLRSIRFLKSTIKELNKNCFAVPSLGHVNLYTVSEMNNERKWAMYRKRLCDRMKSDWSWVIAFLSTKPELLSAKSEGHLWKISPLIQSAAMEEDHILSIAE